MNNGDTLDSTTLSLPLALSGGNQATLGDYAGNWLVLYFYPKDSTPGCTTEAKAFTALADAFGAANTVVIGMSKDTAAKHDKFIAKHNLSVLLASDESGAALEAYGVWVEKNMYGRKYMGTERATFLIDKQGKIAQIWRKVKVADHVDVVLEAAQAL